MLRSIANVTCTDTGIIHCHAVASAGFVWYGSALVWLVVLAVLAFIPSTIAHHKGRSAGRWWLYGFFFFLIALIHSLAMAPTDAAAREKKERSGHKACPFCAEMIRPEAIRCRYCGSEVPEAI